MLSRFRSLSIRTVHFKRQLSSLSFPSHATQLVLPSSPTRVHSENPSSAFFCCFSLLKLSARLGHLCEVKQVHGLTIKLGFYDSLYLQNHILYAYGKCGEFNDADKLFGQMPVRNVVTWNILICGVIDRGSDKKHRIHLGFCYLSLMMYDKVNLDYVSFIGLMRMCAKLTDVKAGSQLHSVVVKQSFNSNSFVGSALVDFYGKCGFIVESRRAFDEVLDRDSVLWNTVISSHVLNGMIHEAIDLLKLMGRNGFTGDGFTFSSLLSACGSVQGKLIHGAVVKLSFESNIPVATALVDMYAKSGDMRDARKCFESMVARNVVLWNAMIVGCGQNGDEKEAMRLVKRMLRENFQPDELTFASILSSTAKISAVREVLQIQALVIKKGFEAFSSVINALINAYSKSGNLSEALLCFNSVREPDLVSWTSVIGGLAFHGFAKESLKMFEMMLTELQPDKIVFLEVLSACSHGGLVQEGLRYFRQMTDVYKIEPGSEHYTCLIDLLGRAGFISEALDVLASMPVKPSSDALAAFVGACNVHGNRGLMKWAAKKLVHIEPHKPVNYSLLSNVYTSEGHWNKAALLRKTMNKICNRKLPGHSWVMDYSMTEYVHKYEDLSRIFNHTTASVN